MTSKGATIDVGAWLRGLGLGQYEATFRENAIDEKVLPNLTAEDLKDMGIGIVGHRRMLLDAIAVQDHQAALGLRSNRLVTPREELLPGDRGVPLAKSAARAAR